MFKFNQDGTILDYIPAEGFDTFVSSKEFLSRKITDILPMDVAAKALDKIQAAITSKGIQTFEYSLPMPTGSVHYEARMVITDDGNVFAVVRNVSERVRAETERGQLLGTLERRNTQLRAAAEISKSCNSILDPALLIKHAVDLILQGFDLYYVGMFLVDEKSGKAILRAGTGRAGEQMLAEGHSLDLDELSMVGWSIVHAAPRIAQQADQDAVRKRNPLLPLTRSELAIPLISRERIIGALTVQDKHPNAFSPEDIAILQTMIDQLAVAIENANLFDAARNEIAERQRVETELQRQRDFAVQIMNTLGQGVTVTDKDGCFEFVNPAYARMLGCSHSSAIMA